MDLRLFFDPLLEKFDLSVYHSTQLGAWIEANIDQFPAWRNCHLAIVGVSESGNTKTNFSPADPIRQEFYALKKGQNTPRICDLGNLRIGNDLRQTQGRLREVCRLLIMHNVLPVVLGGKHDLELGVFWAYEDMEKMIFLLNVDSKIDLEGHTQEILLHKPNYLFSFGHLAHQAFLNNPEHLEMFRRLHFETLSVGEMRSQPLEIEPLIRQADMLSFDMTAIKRQDAPAHSRASIFGLSGEEACQIMWYAGLNERLSSVGIYEYEPALDNESQTAMLIGVMLWYFVEGFYARKHESVLSQNYHTKYIVPFLGETNTAYELIFYKSWASERWWLEIPNANELISKQIVPCSYQDFEAAHKGILPDRWVRAINRKP